MKYQPLYILLIFASSCTIYSPQVTPPIIVEDAGEIQFDVGVSGDLGVQTNFAVAATDHLALQVAARFYSKNNYMLDGSIGLSKNVLKRMRVGIFGGYSGGYGENKYTELISYSKYEINGSSKLIYLKPQFILHTSKIDFVVSSKFGNINQKFYYYEENRSGDGDIFNFLIDENRELDAFFIEPAISMIIKFKRIRLVGSGSFIKNYGSEEQQGGISPFNVGLSIQFLKKAK